MRAALRDGDFLTVVDAPDLPVSDGEVGVEVLACGVCGSDLRAVASGGSVSRAGAGGHEVVGRVAVGGPDWQVGRRVVVDPGAVGSCGRCAACEARRHWFCSARRGTIDGGFAERLVAPPHALHAVPDALPDSLAALAEPVSCGVHALGCSWTAGPTSRIDGRTVVVIGAGMLGLGATLAAVGLGAAHVEVVARHPFQASAARALGATARSHEPGDDLVASLRALRPDLVVDAVGGDGSALELAGRVAAWRGEVVGLGGASPRAVLGSHATTRELRYFFPVSSCGGRGRHDLDVALDLLVRYREVVSRWPVVERPLELVADAFAVAADKRNGAVRVLVRPGAPS